MRQVTNEYTPLLERAGVYIRRGWDSGIAEGLVVGAQEPHVLLATPRDASERFSTLESAESWYNDPVKQRVVYTLGDKAIGGVAWFSKEPYEDISEYTFAIRMYSRLRGKKLAGHFLEAVHRDFALLTDEEKTWLSVDEQNESALHLYRSTGYETVDQKDGRIIMVRDPSLVREQQEAQYTHTHELNEI